MNSTDASSAKIPVGISECLLGKAVRFNGGHKHSKICTETLGDFLSFVPTCPEMAVGLGVPRKPIRLVQGEDKVFARGTEDPTLDVTEGLENHGDQFHRENPQVCGFIFTQNSPSCGLKPVKVYHENGNPLTKAPGIFAKSIVERAPYLPVEEAGRLNDSLLRETFVTAVYAYHDWLQTVAHSKEKKALIDFHARNKYLLMSHSIATYKQLGVLLSNLKSEPLSNIKQRYLLQFMTAVKEPTTKGMHCNAMEHVQGYLKKHLNKVEKVNLKDSIHEYRKGHVPLVVPITLLDHYTKVHFTSDAYIRNQTYLNPHPRELGLRNEI